ncbi:uncharacterized protein [Solanum tuberosum]|uniref:uncharacterized protein n=1 Tax=Solanum tuberosum TaxID=4113 RepID=UPI00073A4233|nr:PREDICTED: uncharacterized protein LOC107062464 [Solanum tuberosum]
METDYIRYVQKCHQCQTNADMTRVPPTELHVTSSPWSFVAWGMDIIGSEFLSQSSLITEPTYSDLMRSLCEKFKISHRNLTAYRPQMNEEVEVANKNIKRILCKMNHKHWHEKLPFALLGYRTTIRTSTGATPYFLEVELTDAKWIRIRSENLALIDGKRINVVCHGQLYQNRMARAFIKKVRPRHFLLGQLVLKRIFPNQDEAKGKFSPNWQGPYIVSRLLTGGALIFAEMDGEVWPKPINSNVVKRYYI